MPLISLIVPVYNTKESWFRECLDSVLNQTYSDWELCLCNNGSDFYISEIIEEYAKKDSRIRLAFIYPNIGGYKGLQTALNISTGQYVGLLDSDDRMPELALEQIAKILEYRLPDVLYTDEMICDENLTPVVPFLKPDFDKYLLYFLHYFGHITFYRTPIIKRLGIRYCGGSYDYDLALRVSELSGMDIHHIPEILYFYRTYATSTSALTQENCIRGALQTLQEHLDLLRADARATQNGSLYQVTGKSGTKWKPNLINIPVAEDNLMRRLFNL
jgi:glycosyltransferase involved in cell wall biosynthesis